MRGGTKVNIKSRSRNQNGELISVQVQVENEDHINLVRQEIRRALHKIKESLADPIRYSYSIEVTSYPSGGSHDEMVS